MPRTKRKSIRKGANKLGTLKLALLKLKAKRVNPGSIESTVKGQFATKPGRFVRIRRLTLDEAAISQTELANKALQLSDTQRASLEAARARAEARLRRPDMSADALRARERAGAEWEARHGPVTAFAGVRRVR
jgi:hypothetical protein